MSIGILLYVYDISMEKKIEFILEKDIQNRYWRTPEETGKIIAKYKDINDIQLMLDVIEAERWLGEDNPWHNVTNKSLYEILMSAKEDENMDRATDNQINNSHKYDGKTGYVAEWTELNLLRGLAWGELN